MDRTLRPRIVLAGDFADGRVKVNARTSGVYWRAQPGDSDILDSGDDAQRATLIAECLKQWKALNA